MRWVGGSRLIFHGYGEQSQLDFMLGDSVRESCDDMCERCTSPDQLSCDKKKREEEKKNVHWILA